MSSRYRRPSQGLTLIELMLAFLIMCLSTLAALGIMSYGHRGTVKDFQQVEALQILVDRMNRLGALPFQTARGFVEGAGGALALTSDFEGIPFGTIAIGKNSYTVTGSLSWQIIDFPELMQLRLPNPNYNKDNVNTWLFETFDPDSFNGSMPQRSYKVIKAQVAASPQGVNRTFEAMTFIVDLE